MPAAFMSGTKEPLSDGTDSGVYLKWQVVNLPFRAGEIK